jgi:hypothetical protein
MAVTAATSYRRRRTSYRSRLADYEQRAPDGRTCEIKPVEVFADDHALLPGSTSIDRFEVHAECAVA